MSEKTARVYAPSDQVSETTVGNETVLLHLGSGQYFGLDEQSSRIWLRVKEGRSLSEISEEIAEDYDVPFETALSDVQDFIEDLVGNSILQPGNQARR